MTEISNDIGLIFQRQPCANTESIRTPALNGRVPEPQSNTDLSGANYIRSLIDNLMSRRFIRCYELVDAN